MKEADIAIVAGRKFFFYIGQSPGLTHLHIGLPRTNPDLTDQDIVQYDLILAFDGDGIRASGRRSRNGNFKIPIAGAGHRIGLLVPGSDNNYAFPGLAPPP